jgi:hypothetical protein
MGFSFDFPVARPTWDEVFLPQPTPPIGAKNLRPKGLSYKLFLGDKQGAGTREKTRTATGLSPDMNCLPHFTIALRRWFTSAADRPAGTREALPGTKALSQRWNVKTSERLEKIYP